ncbi:hypothetical protein [Microbacterium pumilum]|uniref:Uncharacterized protein n=1 Tax=Microbacterium pumilum TaxID=344165 RepID=A0ABP5D350_9MICO
MRRNPYHVGLLSAGGFVLVLAFMIDIVIGQMTDYATWDVAGVATLQGWVFVLVGVAGAMFTGATVISGVAWSLRHRDAESMAAARDDVTRSLSEPVR